MVCDKCAKKLQKIIVPDTWKDGSMNNTGGEKAGGKGKGRDVNPNQLLSKLKNNRFTQDGSHICRICKKPVHQWANYCNDCAYKKGICARCGKKVVDTSEYKMSSRRLERKMYKRRSGGKNHIILNPLIS